MSNRSMKTNWKTTLGFITLILFQLSAFAAEVPETY